MSWATQEQPADPIVVSETETAAASVMTTERPDETTTTTNGGTVAIYATISVAVFYFLGKQQ